MRWLIPVAALACLLLIFGGWFVFRLSAPLVKQPGPSAQLRSNSPQFPSTSDSIARGRVPGIMIPSVKEEAREFLPLGFETLPALLELKERLRQTTDESESLALLDQLELEYYNEEILPVLAEILRHPDQPLAVKLRAIEILEGNISPKILRVLNLAWQADEPELRERALLAAAQLRSPMAIPFFASAIEDPDPRVRLALFDAISFQTDQTIHQISLQAMNSAYPDAAMAGFAELQVRLDKNSVESFINGLAAPDPNVRAEVAGTLELIFHESFTTPEEARLWWQKNQFAYDQDLVFQD